MRPGPNKGLWSHWKKKIEFWYEAQKERTYREELEVGGRIMLIINPGEI
jgi:hypothetical protein